MANPVGRYTGIWRTSRPLEKEWLREIFAPYLAREVVDEEHTIVEDRVILFETFVNSQEPASFAPFKGREAYLVDISDEHYEVVPEIYTCFRGVIRLHWSDVFLPEAILILPLGYANKPVPTEPLKRATERQYVWSFLGQLNKSSRPDMARALARVEPHLLFTTDDTQGRAMWNRGPGGTSRRYTAEASNAILADSAFAPCPMGNSNLECFRVYEALEMQCIPLLERRLTLDLFRSKLGDHPMPTFRSWRKARQFVEQTLRTPEQLDALQSACVEWWTGHKAHVRTEIGGFLTRRSEVTGQPTFQQLFKPRLRWPAFTVLELLRHHDLRAALRRVEKMARRLLGGSGLRVQHRPPGR